MLHLSNTLLKSFSREEMKGIIMSNPSEFSFNKESNEILATFRIWLKLKEMAITKFQNQRYDTSI